MHLSDVGREVSTFDSGVADIRHVFTMRTVEVLGNRYVLFKGKWDGNSSQCWSIVEQ